jgi:hypothetical protein
MRSFHSLCTRNTWGSSATARAGTTTGGALCRVRRQHQRDAICILLGGRGFEARRMNAFLQRGVAKREPVHGRETRLSRWGGLRLRLSESSAPTGILGPPGGGQVTGEWRELHNEELHYLYSSLRA